MSSRDDILARVRAHRPAPARALPEIPFFDPPVGTDLLATFTQSFLQMGGTLPECGTADPIAVARQSVSTARVVCSRVPEIPGNRPLTADTPPASLADVDVGVVRASFGVAETGSLCLTETDLLVNTLGYLPQHLVVLLDPAQIVSNLHRAYQRSEWRSGHYAVLQSGPSATADIEGVLVHGAQGVRSLRLFFVPRRTDTSGTAAA
ncbi:LUD domain-containing protein [Gluconacetobacter entanii]|uniref:LutC/YkgG family protein n=1 Tax=Gluconacetobacter entanii TaxID=108528 RepID=UPI001C9325C2|nr:LUD domain-containing protein [Gluconacetobacter entanii]MBY4640064.1 LUD domain-containing protein [Gluconacetobacter entanii]MCW4581420.1 LUD domain-containing protein [Gluconacetobacter entanii]MCW4584740.1 LUD domain-containing protein [Gluconacetobacter entanii]MCW4588154.1 LUD domain-containing protein [Gluconacetobacter entanii]